LLLIKGLANNVLDLGLATLLTLIGLTTKGFTLYLTIFFYTGTIFETAFPFY